MKFIIRVMLLGMVMFLKLSHRLKAPAPMLVTLFGIVISVKPGQEENILNIDNQLLTC